MRVVAVILLLAGCSTPQPPPDPAWLPKIGDVVMTKYCADCSNYTGAEHATTITKVVRYDDGQWRVMSDEFPNGITLDWVRYDAKWQSLIAP
jgi:hypothetical protein